MSGLPDGDSAGEQRPALRGEDEDAAAGVGLVRLHADETGTDKAAAHERLEGGGEGGAVHGEKAGDGGHGRRRGAVQRHEQRELAVGEAERAEGRVKPAGQGAGGALHVKAEAMIPHEQRGGVREHVFS